jgi:hypothetical protein
VDGSFGRAFGHFSVGITLRTGVGRFYWTGFLYGVWLRFGPHLRCGRVVIGGLRYTRVPPITTNSTHFSCIDVKLFSVAS